MKSVFEDAGGVFRASTLDKSHWQAFRGFYRSLSKPYYFSYLLEGPDEPQSWMKPLDHENLPAWKMFGLWDKDKLIGVTGISFKEREGHNVANFTASEIADSYRGLGLSKHLYDVRKDYLGKTDFKGIVETYIEPQNERSCRAAQSQGFIATKDPLWDGHQRFVFS